MHYNEPCSPLFTRNPLENRQLNRSQNDNTFSTSKRSSITHKQSVQPIKKRTNSTIMNKENVECTFQPRINESSKNKRSVEKFLKDQESFQRAKEMKIQQLRQEINRTQEESMTGTPHVDRMSRQITASQRSSIRDNTFDRLSREKSTITAPEEYLFSPKILSRSKSIVRKTDVSSLLYDDAKRRQEKEQMLLQSERKQIDLMMSPKINRNTNALVLKKIHSEFKELATDEEINPLIALSILEQIFNVDLNPNKNSNNSQLVQKIISLLAEKESFGTLKSQKLQEFISIIVIGPNQSRFFTPDEEIQIIQNFQFFYKERVTRQRRSPTPEKLTFRPKTLASSSKLANSFREKTCQQLETFLQTQKISNLQIRQGSYTIQDLFLIDHMKKQTQNQKKKIAKENKELESCTFHPDVSTSKSSINLIKKKPKVTLKVASKKHTFKTQYTNCDAQSQAMNNSKIYLTRNRQSREKLRREALNITMSDNVRDSEKAVLRMSIGREKREFSQSYHQRGYPKNQNWTEHQRQMHLRTIENNKRMKGLAGK